MNSDANTSDSHHQRNDVSLSLAERHLPGGVPPDRSRTSDEGVQGAQRPVPVFGEFPLLDPGSFPLDGEEVGRVSIVPP